MVGWCDSFLYITSKLATMRDFPWSGHQHHIQGDRERSIARLAGWRWLAGCTYARPLEMPNSFPLQDFGLLFCWCLLSLGGDVLCRPATAIYFHFATSYPKAPSDRTVLMRMRGIPQTWKVATFQSEPGAKLYAPGRSYTSRAKRIAESRGTKPNETNKTKAVVRMM